MNPGFFDQHIGFWQAMIATNYGRQPSPGREA